MSSSKASQMYCIPRTTLRNKFTGKSPEVSLGHSGILSILGNENEQLLVDWVLASSKMGFPVDREGLLSSVKKLVDELDLKTPFVNNRPGKKWFYSFMQRHKILFQKHAEYVNRARGSVTEEKIRNWFTEVYGLLGDNTAILKEPNRIFNLDETCFHLAPKGELILGERGKNVYDEHSNSNKENITTLFVTNALGTWAPPLTLYKYERIPAIIARSAPPGWGIGKSENGWMTAETFFEYISNIFLPFIIENNIERPVVVFLDGHKSHLSLHLSKFCRENKIIMVALYPNSTHIIQPLDVAVFGPLKCKWKKIVKQWRIENDTEISKFDIPLALSRIIHNPEMKKNIESGFRATGLYPFNSNNVDYTKIIVRTNQPRQTDLNVENVMSHLMFIERKIFQIDIDLLDQFKRAERGGYGWDGNEEAALLFKLWLEVRNDIKNYDQTNTSTPVALQPINYQLSPTNCNGPIHDRPTTSNQTPEQSNLTLEEDSFHNENALLINDMSQNTLIASEAQQSVRSEPSIVMSAKRSLKNFFDDIIKWPVQKETTSKRKKEYTPSVITSDKWIEYYELKEQEKLDKEIQKENKKTAAQEKKKEAEQKKMEKLRQKELKMKEFAESDESSELNESWCSSQSNDSESLALPLGQLDLVTSITDLKPGDYILVQFESKNKIKIIYKYVATVQKLIEGTDVEIQCFEAVDEENTAYIPIENDISVIELKDIIGKLPYPELKKSGRQLKSVFPGVVDTFEK